MVYQDYKKTVVKLIDPRIFIEGAASSPLATVDFEAEMLISEINGAYNLQSGWFFDSYFNKSLVIYVFQIQDTEQYNLLQEMNINDLATFLYEIKKNLTYQTATTPKLDSSDIEKLGFAYDDKGNKVYKIPFNVDKPFQLTPNSPTLAYIFLPVVETESKPIFGGAIWKAALRNGDVAEDTPQYVVKPTNEERLPRTSVEQEHYHLYSIDDNGNGKATSTFPEGASPTAENYNELAQHQHQVVKGVVQSAVSAVTGKAHIHELEDVSIISKENTGVVNVSAASQALTADLLTEKTPLQKAVPTIVTPIGVVPTVPSLVGNLGKTDILRNINQMPIFSELMLSKDEQNVNAFIFGINMNQVIKKSTVFPHLSPSSPLKQQLVSNSRISSLKVYRIQISDGDSAPDVNSFETPFLVASSLDGPVAGTLETQKRYLNHRNQIVVPQTEEEARGLKYVGEVKQINVPNINSGVRHYQVVDFNASTLVNGRFKYYVEIEIEDAIFAALTGAIDRLKNSETNLNTFLIRAQTNFDPQSRRFRPDFIKETHKNLALMRALNGYATTYINTLSYFTSTADTPPKLVMSLLDPKTATLTTINRVIEAHNTLIEFINSTLNKSVGGETKKSAVDGIRSDELGKNSLKRKLNLVHNFNNNPFSRSIMSPREVGYAFFDRVDSPSAGANALPQVSLNQLRARFEKEMKKVNLPSGENTITILGKEVSINSVGELTPSRVLIGKPTSALVDVLSNLENLNVNLQITQINDNGNIYLTHRRSDEEEVLHNLYECNHNSNMCAQDAPAAETCDQIHSLTDVVDDKTEMLEPGEDTIQIEEEIQSREHTNLANLTLLEGLYNASFSNNPFIKNSQFVSEIKKMTQEELNTLPYHTLALAPQVLSPTPTVNWSRAYQSYMNLYKMEVFGGYEILGDGECSVLSPIFQEVTSLEQVRNPSICRLVSYENALLKFGKEEKLSLPLIGTYFLGGGE